LIQLLMAFREGRTGTWYLKRFTFDADVLLFHPNYLIEFLPHEISTAWRFRVFEIDRGGSLSNDGNYHLRYFGPQSSHQIRMAIFLHLLVHL
jgi:hypothetical protein